MKPILLDTSTAKEWLELNLKPRLWLKFIRAIQKFFATFTSVLAAGYENFILKSGQTGVRLINGGYMATKHLDSWQAFTHLAVRKNAKSSWLLTSISRGQHAVKQLKNKLEN